MGITLEDATFAKAGNTGYNATDGTFSIALTLDVDALRSVLENGQTVSTWGTDIVRYMCNGTPTGVTINGGSNGGKISSSGLYARWGEGGSGTDSIKWGGVRWDGGSNLGDLNGDTSGTGWDDVAFAGLVYTFEATGGTKVSVTLLSLDGTEIVNSYVTADGLKSSSAGATALTFGDMVATSYYFDTPVSEADSKTLVQLAATTAPIPEPTTATLSLLALAGLAARRRRK